MRTCYVYGVDGARLKLIENLPPTQDCTAIPASAPATVYFGAVEIRNWQIGGIAHALHFFLGPIFAGSDIEWPR